MTLAAKTEKTGVRPQTRESGREPDIVVKQLGRVDYHPTWLAMRAFTLGRDDATPDELWLLEHPRVYTVGQGADLPSVRADIPVVKTDRGGDITYHGPGRS